MFKFKKNNKCKADGNKTIKINLTKLKSSTPQKVGRIILWVLIGFLLLRGIGSILRRNSVDDINNKVNELVSNSTRRSAIAEGAGAYAEGFAKEYMTYKAGNGEEYRIRLSKYLPSYLNGLSANIVTESNVQALGAEVLSKDFYSDNQINVDVKVNVKYTKPAQNANGSGAQNEEIIRNVFLRVPVIEKDGMFVIEDMPSFIAQPNNASVEFDAYSGTAADQETTQSIQEMLQSFIKTYYEGNEGEISYYMSDSNNKVKGLNGLFKFISIDQVNVYTIKSNEYVSLVNFVVQDPISKQDLKQRIHVEIVKKDNKYYIKRFNVRTGNLKNIGGASSEVK